MYMSTMKRVFDILVMHKKLIMKHCLFAFMTVCFLFGIFYCVYPDVTVRFSELTRLVYIAFVVEFSSLLFKQRVRYIVSVYALSAFLSLILLVYKLVYNVGINKLSLKTYIFFIAVSSLITILTTLGNAKLIPKIIGNILAIISMFVVAVFFGYYVINRSWFGTDAILAIMQTNSNEALEYASNNGSFNLLFSMLFLSILAIGWKYINSKIEFVKYNNYIYIYIISIIAIAFICNNTKKNVITNMFVNSQKNLASYQAFEKQVAHRKKNIAVLDIKNNENAGVFVLVIGESQNRDNMHAYGYCRENTPWLSSIRDSNNVLFFNKAYSCHTHTVPVLTYVLTSKNQYNNNSLAESTSLLEMAEAAGYETVWISNQLKYGVWDTPISVIANEANQQFWYNDNRGEVTLTNFYDEKLLCAFSNMKIKDKMLIVVHLMGNHGAYENRYPKDFNKYGNDNNLNKYDNSILYNDYVVKNIYENISKLPNFQGMVYFADHADAVQQGLGHDSSQYVPSMTHIPMYMYFTNQYIDNHREQFSNLKKAENKMFTNDLVYNYMLSILGIYDEKFYEQTNDLTNANYNSNESRFRTLHGKCGI